MHMCVCVSYASNHSFIHPAICISSLTQQYLLCAGHWARQQGHKEERQGSLSSGNSWSSEGEKEVTNDHFIYMCCRTDKGQCYGCSNEGHESQTGVRVGKWREKEAGDSTSSYEEHGFHTS